MNKDKLIIFIDNEISFLRRRINDERIKNEHIKILAKGKISELYYLKEKIEGGCFDE